MPNYTQFVHAYTKRRKDFGRQPLFQQVPGHIIDSIYPDIIQQKEYGLRNPVHRETQTAPSQAEHEINTEQVVFHEQGINHTEGGWPREVHLYNEDHVERHCRRVLHDDGYIQTIRSLAPQVTHYLHQNNAIDMYQTYFADMQEQAPVETYNIREANVFRDPYGRPVSCVVWTNEKQSKLAVSYCKQTGSCEVEEKKHNVCYLWDVTRQTTPAHEIIPDSSCCQLACSPVDPEILIAGLENGTVNLFDIRTGKNAVSESDFFKSHFGPVSSLLYTHSRTNTEFFTGSPDGSCLWWDLRNISQPIDRLIMAVTLQPGERPQLSKAEGVSSLEFHHGVPTKFLCGTESGLVINVNRMGREHSEVISSHWKAHTGRVQAVQRSPCTLRMFVTCGDFTVRVWSEEVRSAPIIVTEPYRYQIADVAWAPLRYSSYMVVCGGGYLYYWDFLRKYREPVAKLQVSKQPLTKITPHMEGESVAVGDMNGSVFLMQLSENMATPGNNDKHLMNSVYNRETRREHNLDIRLREIRLKLKSEEEKTVAGEQEMESDDEDELDAKIEEEYFKTVTEELHKLGGATPSSYFS